MFVPYKCNVPSQLLMPFILKLLYTGFINTQPRLFGDIDFNVHFLFEIRINVESLKGQNMFKFDQPPSFVIPIKLSTTT